MSGTTPQLGHSLVRAGAGAGKTRGLVERVVEVYRHFAAHGERPRIVVTTFTRKATQELKERLILKACDAQDPGLLQFVTDPSRLQISTIHGLLNIFLRQVGHLAGMDAGFQIMSEGEGGHLARLALRETLLETPESLALLERYGFARALAMCRRYEIARRESGSLQPATIDDIREAGATAIARWKERLADLAASILEEVDEPKFAEFAHGLNAFVEKWTGAADEIEGVPAKPRRSKNLAHLEPWFERLNLINDLKEEFRDESWNQERWPAMAQAWADFAQIGESFVAASARLKDEQARFEMGDLELKSIEILRDKPFLGAIFAENWDYWMIDEYQDTSPLQVACLTALIGDRPTYYVGDPQQSIYLFRGAEVRVFDEAEARVRERGGEVKNLLRNYRSEPDLLQWINDFVTPLGSMFRAMEPRESRASEPRSCVRMLKAADPEAEMRALVSRVHELLESGVSLDQICVLGRTHRTLMDASRALRELGYPTHVHSARGFNERRETLDAQALWKFLVNPHDNLSLLLLLRSPWFLVEDRLLTEWMADRPASLWRKLLTLGESVPESVLRLKQAQERLTTHGLARTFEYALCANAVIDLSLVNDPAGRKESNLWKLILRAREVEKAGGENALEFLEKGAGQDALDASEGDATSAQEPNSINLMTIHGSKGLEFEHVIIPRMGERPQVSDTPPLAAADGRFFFPLLDDQSADPQKSLLDRIAVDAIRERELEEFDRWLYVALTRAKSTLTLIWSQVANSSWASRSALFDRQAGEHRNEAYCFTITEGEYVAKPYTGPVGKGGQVRKPWSDRVGDGAERHSVTEIVESKPTSGYKSDDLLKRWQAQNKGTGIHRALEALKYGSAASADDEAVNFVLGLNDPPMRELIHTGEAEWGFQVQTPSGVVPGQIDLWSKHEGKLYVIDYKSGSTAFKDSAFKQLEVYAWALRKFGHQEPVELVVIYPLLKKVERREFTEDLFASWELEFSRPQA